MATESKSFGCDCSICERFHTLSSKLSAKPKNILSGFFSAFMTLSGGITDNIVHLFQSQTVHLVEVPDRSKYPLKTTLCHLKLGSLELGTHQQTFDDLRIVILEHAAMLLLRTSDNKHVCGLKDCDVLWDQKFTTSLLRHNPISALNAAARHLYIDDRVKDSENFFMLIVASGSHYADIIASYDINEHSHLVAHVYGHFALATRAIANEIVTSSIIIRTEEDKKRDIHAKRGRFVHKNGPECFLSGCRLPAEDKLLCKPRSPDTAVFHVEYGENDGFTVCISRKHWLPTLENQFHLHAQHKFKMNAVGFFNKKTHNFYWNDEDDDMATLDFTNDIILIAMPSPPSLDHRTYMFYVQHIIEHNCNTSAGGETVLYDMLRDVISDPVEVVDAIELILATARAPNFPKLMQKVKAAEKMEQKTTKSAKKKKKKNKNKKASAVPKIDLEDAKAQESMTKSINDADLPSCKELALHLLGIVVQYHTNYNTLKTQHAAELEDAIKPQKEMEKRAKEMEKGVEEMEQLMKNLDELCTSRGEENKNQAATIRVLTCDLEVARGKHSFLMDMDDKEFENAKSIIEAAKKSVEQAEKDRFLRKLKELEAKVKPHECLVCMDAFADRSLQCGHVFCLKCVEKVEKCPKCRQQKQTVIRLYL